MQDEPLTTPEGKMQTPMQQKPKTTTGSVGEQRNEHMGASDKLLCTEAGSRSTTEHQQDTAGDASVPCGAKKTEGNREGNRSDDKPSPNLQKALQQEPAHIVAPTPPEICAQKLHIRRQRINSLTHEMGDVQNNSLNQWESIEGAITYRTDAVNKKTGREEEEKTKVSAMSPDQLEPTHTPELGKGDRQERSRSRSRRARISREHESQHIPMTRLQKEASPASQPPMALSLRGRVNNLTVQEKAEMRRLREEHGANQRAEFVAPESKYIFWCPIPNCNAPINQNGFERSYKRHINMAHRNIECPIVVTVQKYDQLKTSKFYPPAPPQTGTRVSNRPAKEGGGLGP